MKINQENTVTPPKKELKISIILPYFNDKLGNELLKNVKKELYKNGIKEKNIRMIRTAGALEIPFACQLEAKKYKPSAIIALGIVIKGETVHFELVANYSYYGIMKTQLKHNIPIIFGIICCENIEQARKRVSEKELNKGKEFAQATIIQTNI